MSLQKPGVKQIDLGKIIQSKNPALYKWLPKPVLNYIRKVIHEKDINEFLLLYGQSQGLDFCNNILMQFNINVELVGKENIPTAGGCIFASNHPLGGLDAIALMSMIGRVRTDIKFLVNDILMNLENLSPLFIPVNKHGKNSAENLSKIEQTYSSEQAILVFPAGLVSRKQSGVIKDLEWKKSFITRAKKHQKNIIPVFIDGKNSKFFYNLSLLRKKLGVKANIEMFYLVDELFKQKGKSIKIIVGAPVSYTIFDKSTSDANWAEKVKDHVYSLGNNETPLRLKTL